MSRPASAKKTSFKPEFTCFRPAWIHMRDLAETHLTLEELEAIRLKDLIGMDQRNAAKQMNISQPTFHRLLLCARKKIATCLVEGKALKVIEKK